MIPYGRQSIDQTDIDAVVEVLQSDYLTQGSAVTRFEQALCETTGGKYAVAFATGTAALHAACQAIGINENSRVWTSPNTFVASANAPRYCGATVDFVDIDPETFNLCPQKLSEKLIQAEHNSQLPDALIVVHFAGQPADMQRIADLCRPYNIRIIEDAAHAIGASYLDQPVGNGKFADCTTFSFHPVKHITTGEGGAVITNQPALAKRAQLFRNHGITRNPDDFVHPSDGDWYYEQQTLGFNFRITDIQCALGSSQLKKLNQFVERRRALAKRYQTKLQGLPVKLPKTALKTNSSWHLYVICIDHEKVKKSKPEIFRALRNLGIGVQVHYIPVHLQPYYRQLGFSQGDFPVAEAYYESAISLPIYPALTDEEQDKVVDALTQVLQ